MPSNTDDMMFLSIKKCLDTIHNEIIVAARQFNRNPDDIHLLAVSKNQPEAKVKAAFEAGQTDFAENHVQQAIQKISNLQALPIVWHFIGQIQSNKCKQIAQHFAWAHCVESKKVAQRLSQCRSDDQLPLNVCLQVNVSNEASKGGLHSFDDVSTLAHAIQGMPRIRLRGLMTIATTGANYTQQRHDFHQLRLMFEQLRAIFPTVDTLSMGMSQDYPAAIAEGATWIRLGTAVFAERSS